jgi:cyclic beta-1,2-glucan synthetase
VLLPASDFAIACVQRAVVRAVGPRRLPRLDFSKGVPGSARAMVIVPTMLTSAAAVDALLEHVEVLALGNLDPCIHFAILSDFADTRTPDAPGDAAILARARAGVEALNRKFGDDHAAGSSCSIATGSGTRRSGVDRLGTQARQDRGVQPAAARRRDTSFSTQVGELDVLPSIRYCITLDSDTRLPRDAAKR